MKNINEILKATRVCPVCGRTLPVSDFRYESHGKVFRGAKCKDCRHDAEVARRRRLGIPPRIYTWTPDRVAKLQQMYATSTAKEIAEQLGVTIDSVRSKAINLGLRKYEGYKRQSKATR